MIMHANNGRKARRIERYLGAVMVGFLLAGCVPQSYEDPIAVMLDRDTDVRFRSRAAQQLDTYSLQDDRYFDALNRLLWEPGYPVEQRKYAIDRLIESDQAGFREVLARRITAIPSWEARCYVFDLAIENDWKDFAATAVLSYTQEVAGISDSDRPERAVIAHANPGLTIEQAVGRVFVNADNNTSRVQQVAAWELLNRLVDRTALIQLLDQSLPSTGLIVDLKASLSYLHVLPPNRESVLWLSYLRDPNHRAAWDRLAATAGTLTPGQRRGLGLRHLPVLAGMSKAVLGMDADELRREVREAVQSRADADTRRHAGDKVSWPSDSGRSDDNANMLCWADWVAVHLVARSLSERSLVEQLFAQADADFADKKSEHGGVLDWHDGKTIAHAYEPLVRRHDRIFYPPPQMIEHLYTAVAHYHFHAQEHRSSQFAKPGRGDLQLVQRMNFNGLVFTFMNRDILHVSYYQPNGAVVDLGVVQR